MMTKDDPRQKVWRTQIVVDKISEKLKTFDICIPAWKIDEIVCLRLDDVPEDIRDQIKVGFRTHVWLNLGAENLEQLFISSWR